MLETIGIMLAGAAVTAAALVLIELLCKGIDYLAFKWKTRPSKQVLPLRSRAEMSETDLEKAHDTQELIRKHFDVKDTEELITKIGEMSNTQRLHEIEAFTRLLAKEYDLGIDFDFMLDFDDTLGTAIETTNGDTVKVNLACFMLPVTHINYETMTFSGLFTIVHELRHCVQYKTIRKPGFWNVDEERRLLWASNMGEGYIDPKVDLEGYAKQAVEIDANTFAYIVWEGVNGSNESEI